MEARGKDAFFSRTESVNPFNALARRRFGLVVEKWWSINITKTRERKHVEPVALLRPIFIGSIQTCDATIFIGSVDDGLVIDIFTHNQKHRVTVVHSNVKQLVEALRSRERCHLESFGDDTLLLSHSRFRKPLTRDEQNRGLMLQMTRHAGGAIPLPPPCCHLAADARTRGEIVQGHTLTSTILGQRKILAILHDGVRSAGELADLVERAIVKGNFNARPYRSSRCRKHREPGATPDPRTCHHSMME